MSIPLHQLRAGVIGTGFIGPVHIEALKRLGVQVTAICGSTKSARACADQWGIPEVYGDYDYRAMFASPNVDVVHITSPNKVHVEQSLAALAAGKHVVCEKPLGMTAKETARVVAVVKRRGAPVFAVNYMCRFFPAVLQMRALVQRGELGQIIHVQGHFFQDWLLHATDYNWRLLASEGGQLRAVGDIGTHWIDAVSFILGTRAEAVFAHLETFHKTRYRPRGEVRTFAKVVPKTMLPYRVDTEDFGSVLLKFGRAKHGYVNGTHANAAISQVAAGWKCSLALGIYGTKGSVRWDLQQPNEIHVGRRDEPNQVLQRATAGFSEDVAGYTDYPGGHPEGFPDSHKMHYRAVYQHIASGRKTPVLFATAADGHHEVKLCEAILKSSRAKRWVRA
ncbi:MAG: gfo/Idh/MocA family oxidoreductase [Verrucomicrobia bacterium]|nr:gfo/Idh/MocA family oxidoreductase [Verrucomicrobiota bacterium]NBU09844.1 gfo/Idh/MocA family oxidoreductase [Pseudomonadota bacterium]NDB75327.1 gfo/Idh/MocA family oxidoreductase [Verrucomicrobiota bacterium]NDD38402.1 gfo/Idh/MocA family oxidoreductase [Verrucomicrobiota bacterium]NDE98222.1 gfo/Idh/MocA family oxidoreductase [Verrucomicrobiota bacterium]